MVRVISVHNFLKQEITSLDEVVDVAGVPPDILLLAQSNNTILVRDLSIVNDSGYSIPTVDQVVKIVYSIQGNYIASLENKVTRSCTKVSYVRVYMNWRTLKENKDSFPMRARIAGRVTPLSQNQQGLEMIEIPTQHMPDNVSCCSVSGNLLLSSKNILTVYSFVIQTHDISKIYFIDFKQLAVDISLSFVPTRHQLLEDVIAAQNDEYLHVFRIKSAVPMCSLIDEEFCIDDCEKPQSSQSKISKKPKSINFEKLIQELEDVRFQSNIHNINEIQRYFREKKELQESELSKVNLLSFPVTHEFPSIALEKSLFDSKSTGVLKQNPFVHCNDLDVNLVSNWVSTDTSKKVHYKTVNICQYHLIPLTIGSVTNREIQEKFTSLILSPYYSNEKDQRVVKQRLLESSFYGSLKCIACFFGTQQEGYLHCFEYEPGEIEDTLFCGKYITYSFTAPVIGVQLDNCFLHAITELGLETYTMRAAKHLMKVNDSEECPSSKDPVCLIGLRSFVNILRMCITNNYLTLFARNEESTWTLYQLKSPDTTSVWKDFLTAAEENKWEAPATYCELLGESHLILKTQLYTHVMLSQQIISKNMLYFASFATNIDESETVQKLYNESCALLGDYHILNKNYKSSYCYYTMSNLKIGDIIKRIRGLWKGIPEEYREKYDENEITKGLTFFLKRTLSLYDQKYSEFVGNREEFYNQEIGILVTSLMDILDKEEKASISDLVLESVVLREFSTDRILKILKNLISKSSEPQVKDALSLALMCIQRDQSDQAKTVLLTLTPKQLETLLLQYHDLLFANNNLSGVNMFTELSMVLIEIYPNVLVTVLSYLLTEKKVLNLCKILNFFMDVMPSGGIRSKNSSCVLQAVLENYFKYYSEKLISKKFDYITTEAMKILIRIYLTGLQQNSGSESSQVENDTNILFYDYRPNYLNLIPPLGVDFSQILLPQNESATNKNLDKRHKSILLKIQSLLSFHGLPDECLAEVRNFLSNQSNLLGSLSLQVLSSGNVQEALTLLVDSAPQALTSFAKECLKEIEDWKVLVLQLQKKINDDNYDERHKFYYQKILSEILHHIAGNLNIEDLIEIIPKDLEDTERYLSIAQSNAQANHIKTLIMITGKQLLATL